MFARQLFSFGGSDLGLRSGVGCPWHSHPGPRMTCTLLGILKVPAPEEGFPSSDVWVILRVSFFD